MKKSKKQIIKIEFMSDFLTSWNQFTPLNDPEFDIVKIIGASFPREWLCLITLVSRFREPVETLMKNNGSISIIAVNEEGRIVRAQIIDYKKDQSDQIFTTTSAYVLRAIDVNADIMFPNPSWCIPELNVLPLDQGNIKNSVLSFLGSVVWYTEQRHILEANLTLIQLSRFLEDGRQRIYQWTGFEEFMPEKITFHILFNWLYVRTVFKLILFQAYFGLFRDRVAEYSTVVDIWNNRTKMKTPSLLQKLEGVERFKNFRFGFWDIEHFWFDYKTAYTLGGTVMAATTYNVHVRAPLSSQKCANQNCNVYISVGLPYCRPHLLQKLNLSLSPAMRQGLTWNPNQLERVNQYADGVFTTTAIAAGATILEYTGPIFKEIQIINRYHVLDNNKFMPYVCKVGENQWIDGTLDRHVLFMMRSHVVPNVELVYEDRILKCKAVRAIGKDEELKLSCVYSRSATNTDTTWKTEAVPGSLQSADIAKRSNPTQVTTTVAESAAFRLIRLGMATLGATAATGKATLNRLREQWRVQTLNQTDRDRLQLHQNILKALTLVTDINEVPDDKCSVCLNPLFQLENGTRKWMNNPGDSEMNIIGPPPSYDLLVVPVGAPLTVSKTKCEHEGKLTPHSFHTSCITTALGVSGECPNCRYRFFTPAINV